jgi:hypothetical protein
MTILGHLGPWLAVLALLAIPLEGCVLAIFMAPWARAYRDVATPIASVFEDSPPRAPTPPEPPIAPSVAPA